MSARSANPVPRVGLIQLHVPENCIPVEQFHRAEGFIRKAKSDHADVVVLPECFLGFPGEGEAAKDAFSKSCAAQIVKLQGLAEELSINIISGSFLEATRDADEKVLAYYNSACYIDRKGQIKLRYRKVNLWGGEKNVCSPGSVHEVIDTEEFGKIGLLICWDLGFPEAFRLLIKAGAKTIFIPTYWRSPDCGEKGLAHNSDSERLFINSTITARAFEQNACIVFCNTGGPDDTVYFGCSQITLPFKGPIIRLNGSEQVAVVDLEIGTTLDDAEEVWEIRKEISSKQWYPAKIGGC